jgi:hypothetical protein
MAMQIRPKPNKAASMRDIRAYILAHCDPDIAAAFLPHGFTLEPILLQLLRELHLFGTGESREHYYGALEDTFRALITPATGNQPTRAGEREPQDQPPDQPEAGTGQTTGGIP